MIKSYKVRLNNVDVSDKVQNISVSIRDVETDSGIEQRNEITIIFKEIPLEDVFGVDKLVCEIEINGKKIDTSKYLMSYTVSQNISTLTLLRKKQ